MKTRKRKIWSVVLIGLLVVTCYVLCEGNTKPLGNRASVQTQLQAAETQTSEQTGPDESAAIPDSLKEEYKNWMEKAEGSADTGYSARMNSYLTKAMWIIEDANIPEDIKAVMLKDFSERAENIRLNGFGNDASDEELSALTSAYSGHEALMECSLERFTFCSLKAGIEPNGKVKKIREILAESLAERKELENRL